MRLPLRITKYAESFIIRDAHDTSVCSIFFDRGNDSERAIRKRMSEEEAEALAKRIARFLTDGETQKAAGTAPKDSAG